MAFLKQASLNIENPEVSIDSWNKKNPNIKTATNKVIEYKKILADFNPKDYLLTHCTIVASVNVEDAQKPVHFASEKTKKEYEKLDGRKDYYVSPDTSKYINSNGDAWSRDIIQNTYKSFIGAENYVEHVQDPKLSKGKILDAAMREVDNGKSIFVDILVATNKKHKDLVDKIVTGKLETLSMGSIVAFTICTQCGRVASDETELCPHIKFLKRNSFISASDGKKRVAAELCGHFLYPESNKFIEGSWVEVPAFKGAVKRNEISLSEEDNAVFAEKYSKVLNLKNPELLEKASRMIAAFQMVDGMMAGENEELPEELLNKIAKSKEIKDPEPPEGVELPEEVLKPTKDKEDEEDEEEDTDEMDAPPSEDTPPEDVVPPEEDTEEMGEAPPEEEEEALEDFPADESEEKEEVPEDFPADESEEKPEEEVTDEQVDKPYEVLKNEIKQNLTKQIKKELLKDLGISLEEEEEVPTSTLDNVDLNESLVRSQLNKNMSVLKKACKIIREEKISLRGLYKKDFTTKQVLKTAYWFKKYSINKDIYKVLLSSNLKDFPTFRRVAKHVEKKMNRVMTSEENKELRRLLKDLIF